MRMVRMGLLRRRRRFEVGGGPDGIQIYFF
jgi:hypothetical protein